LMVPVAVIVWQYSRRRTSQSRRFLLLSAAAFLIIEALTPYLSHVERKFPLVGDAQTAPIRLTFSPLDDSLKKLSPRADWGGRESIRIPLKVAEVPESSVIQIAGTRIKIFGSSETLFDPGWKPSWQTIWPTSNTTDVDFQIDKKLFERIKAIPVTIDLSLALNEFRETSPREILLQDGEFAIPGLGICKLSDLVMTSILCRLPNQGPALMARAPLSKGACREREAQSNSSTLVGRELLPLPEPGFTNPRLDPIQVFSISPGAQGQGMTIALALARSELRMCPGTSIHLATPVEAGRFRIEIHSGPIVLADYVLKQFPID
jgi:hypothetical protein